MVGAPKALSLAGIVGAALLSFPGSTACAASISLIEAGQPVILVQGPLLPSDDTEFQGRVNSLTKAIVSFNSDGGSLLAGIAIGKTIRQKSFATVVLDGQRCASACAFAWLGGSPRLMGSDAFIGFHAVYVNREGQAMESGVGNALLGSYLTQLGLSESAVVYVTKAAPTEMTWLNFRDAEQIGIGVMPWHSGQSFLKASPSWGRDEELSTRARSFVTAIQSRWSDASSTGLNWLDTLYAYEVDYYGKRLVRDSVVAEKRQFAERWPERAYKIQPNSMMALCGTSECVVTGNVEWEARSRARNAASSGMASFAYVLVDLGGKFLISGENGHVIQLRPSALSAYGR